MEVHSSPIALHNRRVLFSIIHDITERKNMEDNLRRRTDELTSLQKTILDITSPHSLPELLNLIVERAAILLDASSGGLYLTEPEQRKVRCVVSYKTKSDFTGTLLDFGVGAAGYVAETGQSLIIDDYRKWAGRATVYEEQQPFQAVMSAPMLWLGKGQRGDSFTARECFEKIHPGRTEPAVAVRQSRRSCSGECPLVQSFDSGID